jgi:hypothetical protein
VILEFFEGEKHCPMAITVTLGLRKRTYYIWTRTSVPGLYTPQDPCLCQFYVSHLIPAFVFLCILKVKLLEYFEIFLSNQNKTSNCYIKKCKSAHQTWILKPVILATQKAEI